MRNTYALIALLGCLLYLGCDDPITSTSDMRIDSSDSRINVKPEDMTTSSDASAVDMNTPDQTPVDQMPIDECRELGSCSPAGGWCEPPRNPECWAGGAPVCYAVDHPSSQRYCAEEPSGGTYGCGCPEGYDIAPQGDACVKIETVDAIFNGDALPVCGAEDNFNYGKFGALFPNTDGNGSNDFVQNMLWGQDDNVANGRLNRVGVWACEENNMGAAAHEPLEEWIGFSRCLIVEEAGDYLLGIAGDNRVRLKVDGALLFERDNDDTRNFSYWHINKITLTSGVHFIELSGYNDHEVAAFGAEISGPFPASSLLTEDAMKRADYESKLIFSTEQLIDQGVFDLGTENGWQCPEGEFALNTCSAQPSCTRIDTIACEDSLVPPTPDINCDEQGECAPNGSWCENARYPECWSGDRPICWAPNHPISVRHCGEDVMGGDDFCVCPEGFEINPNGDGCVRVTQSEATFNGQRYTACDANGSSAYGWGGALYQDTDGDPTNNRVVDDYWGSIGANDDVNGRLNQVGIWACDTMTNAVGSTPINEWIGFSYCLIVEEAGDYLVGIAGDNRVRLKLNGQVVFELDNEQTRNFNFWHIRRVSLESGMNFIELSGLNDGLIAAFGAEISGPFTPGTINSEAQQKAADYAGHIIFSTGDQLGQLFDLGEQSGWSCPDGVALNTCGEAPSCSETETAACLNTVEPDNSCVQNADSCDANALCLDTEMGYNCVCLPGYEGDGVTCTPILCPENASGAPQCECDDGYQGILTFDYDVNAWLGECIPADPCDDVQCAEGQHCDSDTGDCVACDSLYHCVNGSYCEPASAPECWAGDAPVCYAIDHPLSQDNCAPVTPDVACECPDGYDASPGQDSCIRATSVPATQNGVAYQVCDASGNQAYGWAGALYADSDGDDSNNAVQDPYWGQVGSSALGRLNQMGIWACSPDNPETVGSDPLGEWIGFSHCLTIDRAGDYLIGIAGDNRVRFKVNGALVFERNDDNTENFNYWHITKVSLQSGVNIIELSGYNDHAVAAFAAEISGPFLSGSIETEAAQKAADYEGNVIFSTGRLEGELFDIGEMSGWSCPEDGQSLNTCANEPECTTIERIECLNEPVDCSGAFECIEGRYCEMGDQPACWQGADPVCYELDHPLSQRYCPAPVDCSEAFECRNGSYCETGEDPDCWAGDAPICYLPEHPLSVRNCEQAPCVGVICGQGEVCDPETNDCVDCSGSYRCDNGSYCETGDNPLCWEGDAPICYLPEHPLSLKYCDEPTACICPEGFSPTPDQEICVQSVTVAATNNATTYEVCPAGDSSAYGWGGALFQDTDGDANNNRVLSDFFKQRLNDIGIWACNAGSSDAGNAPIGEWIGFSRCLDVAVGGDYLIGIAGDNRVRFRVNGQLIFERDDSNTSNFNYWHVIKVSLNSGVNVIELSGYNDGLIAAFGAEISGPFPQGSLETEVQQMSADYEGNLIFSTGRMEGELFDIGENSGWSCPEAGYVLNTCSPEPECTALTYLECEESPLVDECAEDLDHCSPNATCTDLEEGFNCSCNFGYLGDGVSCELAPCPEQASGAPNCICDEGFSGELSFDTTLGWSGLCSADDPCADVICESGEACDSDTGACVDCARSYQCIEGRYCETGDQPACWQGADPVCYELDHPLSQRYCPAPVDCSEAFECRNGSYCETGEDPDCWAGDAPICYLPEHPLSVRNCEQAPCVGVICGQGEVCDPETNDCVDCSGSYRCDNGSYCETGDNPLCWEGDAPICYLPEHPLSLKYCDEPTACICPEGFSPTPDQEICVQSVTVAATNNATMYEVCPAGDSSAYGWGGALFQDTDGDANNNRVLSDFFKQRLNDIGIWACNAGSSDAGNAPIGEWIGFSRCLDVAVGGDYLIGIAGDNRVRFRVNGQLIFERDDSNTSNFNYWHVIKVSLNSGVNVIELSGYNDGLIAAFGAEISGPFPQGSLETEVQQMSADYEGNLIFSTGRMEGELFDIGENSGWSCPEAGYVLNTCSPEPECTALTYLECEESPLVDECAEDLDHCSPNATCTDLEEGFNCSCNFGYLGDGVSCELAPCPEQASGAPNCICDEGFSGELSFDTTLGWSGLCSADDPCADVICESGEACDSDTGACVDCARSYQCIEGRYCETGDQPACWQGADPVCYELDHPLSQRYCPQDPTCNCPVGYTATPANDACIRTNTVQAQNNANNYSVCDASGSTAYGWGGALYEDTDGDPDNNRVNDSYWGVSNSTTEGRLNTVGIWACEAGSDRTGSLPTNEWIGFSRCLDIATAGDYLIGIAGDNRVRFKVDGAMVFELNSSNTSNFNYWHVRKISLTSGVHVIELFGRNDGNVAAFGAEISGPFPQGSLDTELAQQQADYAGNIIFSTETMLGQDFDIGETSGWSCPEPDQSLNTCGRVPTCTSIDYVECISR